MKKFLVCVVVLVALVVAGGYTLSRMVSIEKVEAMAKQAVYDKTGRTLGIGAAHVMLWPSIGVRLTNVTLSNPSWANNKQMLALGELDVSLALKPLLDKRVEVRHFTIKKPVVDLEVAADGRNNWTFVSAKPSAPAADKETGQASAAKGGLPEGVTVTLGKFEIEGGALGFSDARKSVRYALKNLSVAVTWPTLESAFQADGAFDYNGTRVNVAASFDTPLALLRGKTSTGDVRLTSRTLNAALSGNFSAAGVFFSGNGDVKISNLGDVLTWLGQRQSQSLPFSKIAFSSKMQLTGKSLALAGAKLALDDIDATGDMRVDYAAKPKVTARLSVGKLDLDRFTGGAVKTNAGVQGASSPSSAQKGWDETPIDFSGLRALDADVTLNTQGFSLKGADVGPCTLTVVLSNGVLSFKSSRATLFGGTVASDFSVDAARSLPAMSFVFTMNGVQAKPVLTTFANFDKLSGAVDAEASVTARGNSQKEIVQSLAGNGAVDFKNGSLQGIDLVNIAKLIQNRLGEMGVGEGKTDFVDMGGTFVISNGVATNGDLKMKGPLVQATGSGTVDLPQKQVRYRLLPVLTASSAVEGAAGIVIPVDVYGPFDKIKIKPDYKSVVSKALSNPEEIKSTAKTIGKEGRAILKEIKKDPNQALQNLLGGGLFGRRAAPVENGAAPAPAPAP